MSKSIRILGKALALAVIVVPAVSACSGVADATGGKTLASYTCADLSTEAIEISKNQDVQILKINGLAMNSDTRGQANPATATQTWHALSCHGTALWSDGDAGDVALVLEVDVDGDTFVSYQG